MPADEHTPLLPDGPNGANGAGDVNTKPDDAPPPSWFASLWSPPNRVLLAGFAISLSFSVTQVSIFYVFRLMVCDVFYNHNPPFEGDGDRCSRNEIAAGTAAQFTILGVSTTFCGTWNLFVTAWQVKRWGPRTALILQTVIPAIRVATQIIGVVAGGQAGIWIIQITQMITIWGGPAGYILVVNTIAGEVVTPAERTALFGKLQGCIMLGVAIGLLFGGLLGDTFGIIRPFQTAFFLFLISSVYARMSMPYISPESLSDARKPRRAGLSGFFEPLKVLAPQQLRLASGQIVKHYGILFLCCGVFLGVVATGYAPILLQMYATDAFGFNQANNGWLLSTNAFMRAVFLIFIFPRIIALGRAWFSRDDKREAVRRAPDDVANGLVLPTEPQEFDGPTGTQAEEEPVMPKPAATPTEQKGDEHVAYEFDLFFLRWSLLVDGFLTAGAGFATQGWHIYLASFLIPFGSGSAPAAKGVITSMCPHSQRADALNAITLVDNIARLSTLGLFGFVFSTLAEVGKSYLTFFCNGAVAVVAMLVLLLSHFPPRDSTLIEDNNADEGTAEA